MFNQKKTSFGARDYLKITAFGFALTALWQSLHSIILPQRLLDMVPETQKNTYLGILTLSGMLLAMLIQPIAGSMSDRSNTKWGRRRPYILAGGAAMLVFISGIGLAGSFAALFIIYCLLQLASNAAQGPYQAFIPEFVPEKRHGVASGVKALLEVAGGAIFVYVSSYFMDHYTVSGESRWLWQILGILMFVIAAALVITLFTVKERPAQDLTIQRIPLLQGIQHTLKAAFSNRTMLWFLVSRLLIYMAFTTIQQFALYYLADVVGVANPGQATAQFLILAIAGMLLITWPAGYLADKAGRKPVSIVAGLMGAAGIGVIAISKDYGTILWAAGIIGVAMGAFNSANWALATDLAEKGEEARYLGIANIATAGGAALARAIGPAIDFFNNREALSGYNFMLWACLGYFITGVLLMFKIKKRS